MNELVSVVIPTYNYSHYVGKAIESVLAQTYSPLECIVVNDGSTDDTASLLESFGERIRAVNQINGGLSNARNTGISLSKGSCIAFLDADDWWEPQKLSKQMSVLKTPGRIMAVGCEANNVGDDGSGRSIQDFGRPTDDCPKNLRLIALRRLWIGGSGSGAVVRKCVFDEVGKFDEQLTAAEDWDMWMRIAARHLFMNVPEPLTNIRRHSTGVFRNAERMEVNQMRVYDMAIQRWPDILNEKLRRQMRALILADAAGELIPGGHFDAAKQKYKDSLREWRWSWPRWKRLGILTARRPRQSVK